MAVLGVLLVLVPALGLVAYYYRQDRFRPEPKSAVLIAFAAGCASTSIAYVLELGFETAVHTVNPERWPMALAASRALVAGLFEEGAKLLAVRLSVYRRSQFDEVTDGIIYTVVAALGFASVEGLIYLYHLGDPLVMFERGLTAVPMHAFASGLMGYQIGLARFSVDAREGRRRLRRGLFSAAALHGFYDFCILTQVPGLLLLVVPVLLFGFLLLRARFATALAIDFQRMGGQLAQRKPWRFLPGFAARMIDPSRMGQDGGEPPFPLPRWWEPPRLSLPDATPKQGRIDEDLPTLPRRQP